MSGGSGQGRDRGSPIDKMDEDIGDFPEEGSDDLTCDSTSSSFSSGPGEMTKGKSKGSRVSSEGDSEVGELKGHLRKKRQSQRNLERMRQEQIWRFRQPVNEIGSDSSDDEDAGEDLKRKRKLREELLQVMRAKMKEGLSDDEDEKWKKGRSRNRNKQDRMKNKRKNMDKGEKKRKKGRQNDGDPIDID